MASEHIFLVIALTPVNNNKQAIFISLPENNRIGFLRIETDMPRWMMFAMFMTTVLTIYGSTHYYVYRRVKRLLAVKSPGKLRLLRITTLLLIFSFPLARAIDGSRESLAATAFHYFSMVWMGFFLYFFLGHVALHLVLTAFRLVNRSRKPNSADGGVLNKAGLALIVLLSISIAGYGIFTARGNAEITEMEIALDCLPKRLDGFRIVQFTDLHLGAVVGREKLQRTVDQVNELKPDLVAITGDLVDEDVCDMTELLQPLSQIDSTYGTVAVTGNHEFYVGAPKIVSCAEERGIDFLRGERKVIEGGLLVYGLDDPAIRRFNESGVIGEELIGPEAATSPAVLLYHRPQKFESFFARGIDLMLTGHTHNGQLWPLSLISRRFFFPYQTGLHKIGGGYLYISRGTGTWGPPMRVGAAPEIVLFVMRNTGKCEKTL